MIELSMSEHSSSMESISFWIFFNNAPSNSSSRDLIGGSMLIEFLNAIRSRGLAVR